MLKLESFEFRGLHNETVSQGKWEIQDDCKIVSPGRESNYAGTNVNLEVGNLGNITYLSAALAFNRSTSFIFHGPVIYFNVGGYFEKTAFGYSYEYAVGSFNIVVESDGSVMLNNGQLLSPNPKRIEMAPPGTVNMVIGKWQHIQACARLNGISNFIYGDVDLYINDNYISTASWVVEMMLTYVYSLWTGTSGTAFFKSCKISGNTFYLDDIYVTDNQNIVGDYHILAIKPDQDILTNWDANPPGTHYSTIDEQKLDNTDYIYTSTLGIQDRMQYENPNLTSNDKIMGYQHVVAIQKDQVGSGFLEISDSNGNDTTIYPGAGSNITYTMGVDAPNIDPSFVNSLQVGLKLV